MKFKSEVQLEALNNATVDTDKFLVSDSSTVKYRTGAEVLSDIGGQAALTNPITGTGTLNYVSKFTGATTLGNSQIFDNGTNVGIGTASPSYKLDVLGDVGAYANGDNNGFIGTSGGTHLISLTRSSNNAKLSGYDGVVFYTNATTLAGGSERMRITSSGNVGIGTTSPATKLQVEGNLTLSTGSSDTVINLLNNASGAARSITYGVATAAINITGTSGSPQVTILNGGNVGIGTTSPGSILNIFFSDGSAGLNKGINIQTGNGTYTPGHGGMLQFQNEDVITAGIRGVRESGWGSGMAFYVHNTSAGNTFGSTFVERMRISELGNVGIGTSSPVNNLHVQNGTTANTTLMIQSWGTEAGGEFAGIRFKSAAIANNEYGKGFIGFRNNGTGYGRGDLYFSLNNSTTDSNAGLTDSKMVITSTGNVGIGTTIPTTRFQIGDLFKVTSDAVTTWGTTNSMGMLSWDTNLAIIGGWANTAVQFRANNAEVMRLTTSGNVGIGTTSPSEKLHVAGNARVTGSIYDSSNSPGTLGQILSSTVTGTAWVAGGGGGSTPVKLTSQTLAVGSWTLVGDYYTYAFSNINVDTTSDISVTPQNASYLTAYNAQVLPFVGVSAGVATFYSQFPPQNDMVVDIVITQTT